MAAVLLILLTAWWLRVVGLDGMHLTGDAAYSVHVAGGSHAEITLGRDSWSLEVNGQELARFRLD